MAKSEKTVGHYIAWVGVPVLITAGGVAAIVQGTVPGITAGAGMILATGFVLWRKFFP